MLSRGVATSDSSANGGCLHYSPLLRKARHESSPRGESGFSYDKKYQIRDYILSILPFDHLQINSASSGNQQDLKH